MNNGFNNIQSEWFNPCANVNSLGNAKKITNPFKCKYEALSWIICVSIYTNKCNMQCLNNGFNKFKVDDLIHIKYWVACVFNIL